MSWHPQIPAGRPQKQFLRASRAARLKKGEYVKHLPTGADDQFLVMWFQDVPQDEALGLELAISTSGPQLRGLVPEFETKPRIYRKEKHAGDDPVGSRFVVRGVTYQAKEVETDHLDGITIRLLKDKDCERVDCAFFEEVAKYQCYPDHGCDT